MDRIRRHILNRARDEALCLVRAAKEEADRRVAAARERIARDLDGRLNQMKAELEGHHQQALDRLAFEHRLEALRRKREIIDEVFDCALARFMETPRYREWLESRLADVADLTGEVLCAERDRALCQAALKRFADEGKTGLTLAKGPDGVGGKSVAGGIVVRAERFDLDLSLESALGDLRAQVMPEFSALAFSGLEQVPSDGE